MEQSFLTVKGRTAFPHAEVQPAGFGATAQLRRLVLSHLSIRNKCHESVMGLVMVYGVRTSSVGNSHTIVERFKCIAAFAAPLVNRLKVGGFWAEE